MNEHRIERQVSTAVIRGADGQLYRVTPVNEELIEFESIDLERRQRRLDRLQRERENRQRNQRGNQIAYIFLAIGGAFVFLFALLIVGSIFASATKPASPEITNPYCQHFCF